MEYRGLAQFQQSVDKAFFSGEPGGNARTAVFPSFSSTQYSIFPGFVDVHVHLREPGFSYKETIATGTAAAARGGYTAVCPMPNLDPVPDSPETLERQLDIIRRDARITVLPYGAITAGERGEVLADMEAMAPCVAGYSDDGRGVQSPDMMRAAMVKAKALGKPIAAHCEDNSLLKGGYIHDGEYARAHGHRGICSESEWGQIAREDGRFKMNPPLRDKEDREALLEGIVDGTIDMIATDHAPHSDEEKSRGLEKSLMGVVGLETAFPILYTYLVLPGVITLERLVGLMSINPRKRFGIPLEEGDFTVWDLKAEYRIDPEEFLSMGRATPFAGYPVKGRCVMTVHKGKTLYLHQ